jgi:uncharacterized protein YggE
MMRLAVTAVAVLASALAQAPARNAPPFVRASGEGTATVKPDQAVLSIGVVTQASTADAAASQNASQVNALLQALKKELGSNGELRTIGYRIEPNYRYPTPPAGGSPTISGYTASNTVQATTRDLPFVGRLIDAATRAGANHVEGIQFMLRDEQPARAQALKQAAQAARANAEAIAAALGVRVMGLRSAETAFTEPIRPRMAMAAEAVRAPTPVEPGAIDIRATVTVTLDVAAN